MEGRLLLANTMLRFKNALPRRKKDGVTHGKAGAVKRVFPRPPKEEEWTKGPRVRKEGH